MLCSPLGFDLSTYEGQLANIRAVKQRIAARRFVKGEPPRTDPSLKLALDTQNQGESAPLAVGIPDDVMGSTVLPSLDAFVNSSSAVLVETAPSFDFASFRTEPLAGETPPLRPSWSAIARLVARELELDAAELWGVYRGPKVCFGRHAAWWLARQWTPLSLPEIGRRSVAKCYAGQVGKDHSTVYHGVVKFGAWRDGRASYFHVPTYAEWLSRR